VEMAMVFGTRKFKQSCKKTSAIKPRFLELFT
jgi:hypothetical protein